MKQQFSKVSMLLLALSALLTMPSCKKGSLTDININPDAITYVVPAYSFTAAVLNSIPGQNYRALGQGLQYYSTYKEVPAVGDKFYNFNGTAATFDVYSNQWNRLLKLTESLKTADDVNKKAACEILRILAFHSQTDIIGDMPYTEAMKGLDQLKPKYDTQKSIYLAMLNELDAALKSMDPSKSNVFGSADPYFKGDVVKWKKFGYTLMLRLGMRMSDIEAATAKAWVEKAAQGGVMTSSADIAYIKYANVTGQFNPRSVTMISGDFASPGGDNVEGSKWSGKFIDHLKNTSDPRLKVLSVVWVPSGGTYVPNNTPAAQRGMVNGSINTKPGDFDTYSEPSLLTIDRGAPIITMGPAEAYLLLAEGALRGWTVGITEQLAYENAVRAAMAQWALWPAVAPHSGTITTAEVDAYIAANPYPASGTFDQRLETISTQKWVSMLGDDYEVYANWRRTKYPVFNYANWKSPSGALISYPGNVTAGKMWRRFSLPLSERNTNNANYLEAIKRQNFTEQESDLLQGRVWWDVGPKTGQN
jgi:hypothetical protein